MKLVKQRFQKELKRNDLVDYLREAWEYFQAHQQNVLITVAIAAVIFALAFLYIQKRSANFDQAQDILSNAAYYESQKVGDPADKSNGYVLFRTNDEKYQKVQEGYNQIINLYPNSPAAADAQFKVGCCYYEMKKYEQAIDQFQSYLNRYRNGKYVPQARLNIAYAWEQKKDYDKAAEIYGVLSKDFKGQCWGAEALWHEAVCLEQKMQKDKAKDCYKELTTTYPDSYQAKDAQAKLKAKG